MIFIFIFAFLFYHSYGLSRFAADVGYKITPWVFPHLFSAPVLQIFAFALVLFFSDAPFKDHFTPFVVIRTGRRNWIIGQIVYIVLASVVITLFTFIVSVLALIPNLEFSLDWGIVIQSLANDPSIAPNTVTIFFDPALISYFSPLAAMGLSFLFYCLVSIFIGVIILCFNVLLKKTAGVVVAGVFVAISLFANFAGFLTYGNIVFYLSPVSWLGISSLGWDRADIPSVTYALLVLILSMIFMSIISIIIYLNRDMDLKEGGF